MAAKLTADQLTALQALSNIEEQVVYVCQQLDAVQKEWNRANPQFQRTAIELNADFINNTVAIQVALPLESSSFAAARWTKPFRLPLPHLRLPLPHRRP